MRLINLLVVFILSTASYSSQISESPLILSDRKPYVMNVTKNEVTLLWKTLLPSADSVRYGKLTDRDNIIFEIIPRINHQYRLKNLDPDSCYSYSVLRWRERWGSGKFCTAPEVNYIPVHFLIVGDSGFGTAEQYRIAELMRIFFPTLVLHVGDVIYPSGQAKLFDKFFFMPYGEIIKNTPFFLTLGNHDIETDNGKPYFDAFDLPVNNKTFTEQFYSFEWGNILFIALDSNSVIRLDTIGKIQLEWLEEILSTSNHRWRFIFLHHPVYSSKGSHGSTPELQERLLPIIERHNVQGVFSGHDHHYERTRIINGTLYVVSGGGGVSVRPVKPDPDFSEVALSKFHFVHFIVTDDQLSLTAIDQFGNIIDHAIYPFESFKKGQ